jgi:fatty acid desaturase
VEIAMVGCITTWKRLTPGEVEVCRRYSQTSLWRSIAAALSDHLRILGCGGAVLAVLAFAGPLAAVAAYLLAIPLIIRSMRGLECLAHDASHWNWYRRSRWLNDALGNLLAAVPALSAVSAYRSTHFDHHRTFNTEADIDLIRHRAHDFAALGEAAGLRLLRGLADRYRAYWPGWWTAIRTDWRTALLFLVWHGSVLVAPLGLAFGWARALVWWTVFWLVPFLFVLPLFRMFAEAGEHDYTRSGASYELTFTNVGWFYRFVYPHNDGYHTLHHMSPSIPFFALRRAHLVLARRFPEQWAKTPLERRGLAWRAVG